VKKLSHVLAFFLTMAAFGQEALVLEKVELSRDEANPELVQAIFTFNRAPETLPVYARTKPERIVLDLANTRLLEGIKSFKSDILPVDSIAIFEIREKDVQGARAEIYLKESAHYVAHQIGNSILVTFTPGDVKDSLLLFRSETAADSQQGTITGVKVLSREKSIQTEVSFASLPMTSSIYMLESPPRIIMDFYGAYIDNVFEKKVTLSPIKSISVIKKDVDPPYVGVILHLKRMAAFKYQELNDKFLVTIPVGKEGIGAGTKRLILLGAGIVITGGVAAGLLLGGDDGGGGNQGTQPTEGDLGAPPPLPGN